MTGRALCSLLVAAAVLAGSPAVGEEPRPLVVLEEQEPQTPWPLLSRTMSEVRLGELLFDRLFVNRAGGSPESLVFAEGWEARGEELSVTLREGLAFSDGNPVTFRDVVFSINDVYRRAELGHLSADWYRRVLGDARQTSPTTGRMPFLVEVPRDEAERYLLTTALLSRASLGNPEGPPDLVASRRTPVGSGPFRTAGPIADFDDIRLTRNPHRLDAVDSADRVEALRLLYDQDAARQRELMEGGRADVWVSPPPATLPAFRADKARFGVRTYDLHQWWYVAVDPSHPHVSRPEVRQALDLALPRGQLVDKLGAGSAVLTSGPFLPSSAWRPADLEPTPEDPAGAAALMEGAGYVRAGGRWTRDGEDVELRLGVEGGIADDFNDVLYGVVDAWEDAGFRVRVRSIRAADWTGVVEAGNASERYDLILGRWNLDREEASLELFRRSDRTPAVNLFGWSSDRTEELIAAFYAESRGPAREALMQQLHRHLHEQRPYLFLWSMKTSSVFRRDRITGFRAAPYYFFSWFDRIAWRKTG